MNNLAQVIFDKPLGIEPKKDARIVILDNGLVRLVMNDGAEYLLGVIERRERPVAKVTRRRTRGRGRK